MGARVEGKVAVITGSTRGIGEGIARGLAAEGAVVVISGIDAAEGEQVAHELTENGCRPDFIAANVANDADCARLMQTTVERFGRLDVLVNNAGIFPSIPLEEMTIETWDEIFAINTRGAFSCCRYALPPMQRQQSGVIISMGTALAHRGTVDRLAYACSKGALLTMTRILAQNYARDHIRVNWITVGWVASPGEIELRNSLHDDGIAFLEEQGQNTPMGRLETPEDMAAGVIFLASDAASHITGTELNITGARWM
jgi:NAD(P)-dependent dehydrogenase (short-subunit alcohol dehydrogenase family)